MASPQTSLVQGYGQAVIAASREDQERVGLIARLMIHYWQPDMTARERTSQALDWRGDLAPYPVAVVAKACERYRRDPANVTRPLPAQIVGLCEELTRDARIRALPAPSRRAQNHRYELSEQDIAERREWAAANGYASWDAVLDAVFAGRASVVPFLAWSAAKRNPQRPVTVSGFKMLGAFVTEAAPPPPRGAQAIPPEYDV